MEFLKEILGDELFKQIETAINAYNGDEANKDKQIKIANLASGEYVGKGKYDALQALFDGQKTELDTANGLIADLKKGTKGNEELQGKITTYEGQIQQLQQQLQEMKINSAIKVALLSEKALDVDYLTYKLNEKLKEKGEKLELDENENIKGIDDCLAALKTQFPTQFEGSSAKKFEPNKLPDPEDQRSKTTKSDLFKMTYAERAKFQSENPTEYETIMKS